MENFDYWQLGFYGSIYSSTKYKSKEAAFLAALECNKDSRVVSECGSVYVIDKFGQCVQK